MLEGSAPNPLTPYQKVKLRRVSRQGVLPVDRPVGRSGKNTLLGRGLLEYRRGGRNAQRGYILTEEGRRIANSL